MWHYVSLWRHMIKSLHTARLDRQIKSSSPGADAESSNCCIYRRENYSKVSRNNFILLSRKVWKEVRGNKSLSYKLVSRHGSLAVCSLLSCRQIKIICLINVHDFSSKWSRNNDYILVSFFNQDLAHYWLPWQLQYFIHEICQPDLWRWNKFQKWTDYFYTM